MTDTINLSKLENFKFDIPKELIASSPILPRDASRLLVIDDNADHYQDSKFKDITKFLYPGDIMIFNDTKVIPAALFGIKVSKHFKKNVDINIIEYLNSENNFSYWKCLIKGKKLIPGDKILILKKIHRDKINKECNISNKNNFLSNLKYNIEDIKNIEDIEDILHKKINSTNEKVEYIEFQPDYKFIYTILRLVNKEDDFIWIVKFEHSKINMLNKILPFFGEMPLPPYMRRSGEYNDKFSYQTVYAEKEGSVAGHTAGLHFTNELLDDIKRMGVEIHKITLHIGAGTFLPIKTDNISDHKMHEEVYSIDQETVNAIKKAKKNKQRIIAVGTTSMRALESAATNHWKLEQLNLSNMFPINTSKTSIFIRPGYKFLICDVLVTNFHMPCSSLFILVCAFGGYKKMMEAYQFAIKNKYRFFSYGDASIIFKKI
ncbi:tRNA preQ1(34) S-adenosylmethionine ribosyltransferase-isomerase QueA [Lyticum sinuosum]|uniref:S-adenosylmethionine:tRNA ribosyltransferase-isomerase n=1 Tax=Lyticum sinuosum TaxID=1332059 RepID=A0AAE4VKJ9_9RICK|nr:tRNA preQ1(34) S-adenosylmethionine ribosyltransferase-isomerase QueA [Lyticum sinuosum]MDZ5761240.1 S-adenosylmethionine:tRNA ribosyltransferase-isomerase [Lyticum sinuosum]